MGQVDASGMIIGEARSCYIEAVESNPSWNVYMKGLENYMLSIVTSIKSGRYVDYLEKGGSRESGCDDVRQALDMLNVYTQNTIWKCNNSGYSGPVELRGKSGTWNKRIEKLLMSKILRWMTC